MTISQRFTMMQQRDSSSSSEYRSKKYHRGFFWLLGIMLGVAAVMWLGDGTKNERRDVADIMNSLSSDFRGTSAAGLFLAGERARSMNDLSMAAHFFAQAALVDAALDPLDSKALYITAMSGDIKGAIQMAENLLSPPLPATASDVAPAALPQPALQLQDRYMAHMLLALEAVNGKKWEEAIKQWTNIPEYSPFQRLLFDVLRAWAVFADGRAEEGLAILNAIPGIDKRSMLLSYQKALMLTQMKRFDEADALFSTMLDLTQVVMPRRVVEVYAASLFNRGEAAKAKQVMEAHNEKTPILWQDVANIEELATNKLARGYLTDADYGMADMLYGVASLARQQDGMEAAVQFLQMALYIRPDYEAARVFLAAIWNEQRLPELAIATYQSVAPDSPYALHARLSAATTLLSLERMEESIQTLRQLSKNHPEHPMVWMHLADALRRHEDFAEAAKAYTHVLEWLKPATDEDLWPIYYMRGICFERSKNWEKAEPDFKKALEMAPDQPDVLNYLAYSWLEAGKHYDASLEMLHKAVEQRPMDAHIVDSVGWAYFRLGQYEEALQYIQQAVELMPTDAVVTSHFGDVLWKLGRQQEARYEWERALLFKPTEEDKKLLERKITHGYIAPKS